MRAWLDYAARQAVIAFAATALIYMPGIWEAPNLRDAVGLGVVALGASIVAVLMVIKAVWSGFSVGSLVGDKLSAAWVARIDLFIATFVGNVTVALSDLINQSPDLSLERAAIVGAMTGAVAAAFRTLVGLGTTGESPAPEVGVGPAVR